MKTKGWDSSRLAHKHNIDLSELDDVDATISLQQYVGFLETVADVFKAPYFGLYTAKTTKLDALGPIDFLFASAPTLRHALEGLTGYISVVQEGTHNKLTISGNDAILEYQILGNSISPRRQDAEYSISINYEHIKNYIKSDCQLREVHFEHQQIGNYATYADHFGCEVFFQQSSNFIVFDKTVLSIANPSISKKLYPILSAHFDNIAAQKLAIETVTDRVNNMLNLEVLSQGAKSKDVAAKMGLTAATMARKLKNEGVSYSGLVKARRVEQAKSLLKNTTIPISHVALQLGYSETASFTRAFKEASGLSPGQYRQS